MHVVVSGAPLADKVEHMLAKYGKGVVLLLVQLAA